MSDRNWKFVTAWFTDVESVLNHYDQEGWDCVNVSVQNDTYRLVLKRRKAFRRAEKYPDENTLTNAMITSKEAIVTARPKGPK